MRTFLAAAAVVAVTTFDCIASGAPLKLSEAPAWLVIRRRTGAAALMERYRDVPMDYADATLVALAEELDADTVFTLDRRGFSTYRLGRRRPFQPRECRGDAGARAAGAGARVPHRPGT